MLLLKWQHQILNAVVNGHQMFYQIRIKFCKTLDTAFFENRIIGNSAGAFGDILAQSCCSFPPGISSRFCQKFCVFQFTAG